MNFSKRNSGVVHLIPLLFAAFVLIGMVALSPASKESNNPILGENSGSGSSGGDSSGSGSSGSSDSDSDDSARDSTSDSSGSGSSNSLSTQETSEPEDLDDEDEVEIEDNEIEDSEEDFDNEIQDELNLGRRVEIENKDGRIKFKVRIGNTTRETEIRDGESRIKFKLEENGIENSVTVRIRDDRFVVTHEGVEATTLFPLTIDPITNTLTVNAPGGPINVVTLPANAVENVLATGKLDEVEETEIEEESNQVVFRIKGVNKLRLLGIFPVAVPVESSVDVSTGQVLEIQEPNLFQIFRFLFAE